METNNCRGAYSVNEWGSHPDEGNDDCWRGDDFATLDEARAAFAKYPADPSTLFVELDGPDVNEVRRVADRRAALRTDTEWQREVATQAGMALGCDGYNDAMDW